MFFKSLASAALVLTAFAKELPKDEERAAAFYDNGLMHSQNMQHKIDLHDAQRASGAYNSSQYAARQAFVPCRNGLATVASGDPNQTFKCKNIDFYSFLPHSSLGSTRGEGSSSWGWTSSTGREFVAIGQADGTAFAEINAQGQLVYLGRLPHNSSPSIWREIRGYKNYMVIGSEAARHNIQIFDMNKLLNLSPSAPKTFSNSVDLTGLFTGLPNGQTHNVVTNEESGFAYSVGAAPRNSACKSGIIFIDMKDPSKPTTPGCASGDGYVHDAQCLVYRGPDTAYVGREICYGYNEDTLTIYDVTSKTAPKIISRTSYTGAAYTHQGWVLDKNNQRYLILDDELDEQNRVGPAADGRPVTYIWDISKLSAPKQTGYYKSPVRGIDHNQYIYNGLSFQSNYGNGLRVIDVSSIPSDPTGAGVKEVAYFDIYPEDDGATGGGNVEFVGSWSSYAGFKSGYIFVNSIERGGFVVKMTSANFRRAERE